jgi:AcrR family transcriptional regulator
MKPAFFQLPAEKSAAVVDAALAEFGANDFDTASLDRIVAAARISKGGLYEYIASKDDLYLYCMRHAWASLYRYIESRVPASGLPADILERFMCVSRIAIEWYLENPAMLGLLVRTARLPNARLADAAHAAFEHHFAGLFDALDGARLAFAPQRLVELVKWQLAKTRHDASQAIAAGRPADAVRSAYLEQWAFFLSVLGQGIYRRD